MSAKENPGLTFLGMSGGVLMLVITLVILVPILFCCLVVPMAGILSDTPEPTVTTSYK